MTEKTSPVFNKLLIVGVGLMGGSLALAAKQAGVAAHVVGWSRKEQTLSVALNKTIIDSYHLDLTEALEGVDGVIIATPTQLAESLYATILKQVSSSVVVSDVASVKGNIAQFLRAEFGCIPSNVVLGHPICGSEQSGVEAAFDSLYRNQKVVLIDDDNADKSLFCKIEAMWQRVDAKLHIMKLEEHDRALALTSHLPHMLSFALMNQLDREDESFDIFQLSGGGFKDFTRIAGSDPTMWQEIALANKVDLKKAIGEFINELSGLSVMLDNNDRKSLEQYFAKAKHLRETRLNKNK
jgi:prephenate dehydrogenase